MWEPHSHRSELYKLTFRWSSKRPGVAISRFTPFVILSASALRFAPPITMPNVCEWCAIRSFATPNIWRANSLVGVMTIMPVPIPKSQRLDERGRRTKRKLPFTGLNFNLCSSSIAGIRNAKVFPDPVRAAPSTSFPANSIGIDFS